MNGVNLKSRRRDEHGFTMIEIAIALAVIGFAIVAIIGVLPIGMQVQQENREETIVNQDGAYWLEAIRNGAEGLDDIVPYVDTLKVNGDDVLSPGLLSGLELIGLLSTPGTNRAVVRSISGSAADKFSEVAFRYEMVVRNTPMAPVPGRRSPAENAQMARLFHDLSLEIRWPVFSGGGTGSEKRIFRTLVSGELILTNSRGFDLYFFRE